ncbi:MAG: CBS domain-containing protein, partial [Planctomycetota bacterium]
MPVVETDIESKITVLASEAFNGFCEDISALFNIEMVCTQKEVHATTVQELQNHFDNVIAVNIASVKGEMTGDFLLIFDHKGLFTLPGIISMTPEEEIIENIEKASDEKAQSMTEALNECGNLIIGSWDRCFRESLAKHDSLTQSDSFIGLPFNEPENKIGLSGNEQVLFITNEMTIGSYPSFSCGVVFPKNILPVDSKANQDDQSIEQQSGDVQQENESTESQGIQNDQQSLSNIVANLSSRSISGYAKDIMQKNVIWISLDDTVETAVSKMKEHDAGYLMVGSDDAKESKVLEGIVSRSDIAGAVSPYLRSTFSKWRRPIDDASLQIRVKWIMSKPVRTVKLDTPVSIIMENMSRYGGRCLPVTDENAQVVGLVTVFEVFNS